MILALDIGGSKIEAVLFDSNNEIIKRTRFTTPKTFIEFEKIILKVKHWNKNAKLKIAIAGFIKNGKIIKDYNIPYLEGKDLSKKFSCEVINDANAYALAQKGECDNFLAITFGTGIGMGIVIDNKLYEGEGLAGELGHIFLNNKTFEKLFSGKLFEKKIGYDCIPEELKTKKKYYHELIAKTLHNLILLFHPNTIYFGGGLTKFLNIELMKKYTMQLLPKIYDVKFLKGKKEVVYGLLES